MPRIRTLKPDHRQHRKVGPLDHLTYRLWVGMILEADDEGRLVADAEQLRVTIFGYHPKVTTDVTEASIQTLAQRGLIRLYDAGGVRYAVFPSWADHQRIDHPSASKLPREPYRKARVPDGIRREVAIRYGAKVGQPSMVTCHYCDAQGVAVLYSETGWASFVDLEMDHVIPEYRGGEMTAANIVLACQKCNRSKGCDDSPKDREDSRGLARVLGGKEGKGSRKGMEGKGKEPHTVVLSDDQFLDQLRQNPAYDGIDLDRELGRMDAWLATPKGRGRKKTRQFVVNWLNRIDRPVAADRPVVATEGVMRRFLTRHEGGPA